MKVISSDKTAHPLAEFPQLFCHGVILCFGVDVSHGAVREVASTVRFETLLKSAVESRLASLNGVLEEEERHGTDDQPRHSACVPCKLRINGSWMEGKAGDLGSLQFLGELMSEEDIAEFAIRVVLEGLPEGRPQSQSFMGGETVKINVAKVVRHGRHVDDPAGTALLQSIQQQVGEEEVTDVVDAEHQPQSILCFTTHENSCVIDEDVQSGLGLQKCFGKAANGRQTTQIELHEHHLIVSGQPLDLLQSSLSSLLAATSQNHPGSSFGQLYGGGFANTSVAACHDHSFPTEVHLAGAFLPLHKNLTESKGTSEEGGDGQQEGEHGLSAEV